MLHWLCQQLFGKPSNCDYRTTEIFAITYFQHCQIQYCCYYVVARNKIETHGPMVATESKQRITNYTFYGLGIVLPTGPFEQSFAIQTRTLRPYKISKPNHPLQTGHEQLGGTRFPKPGHDWRESCFIVWFPNIVYTSNAISTIRCLICFKGINEFRKPKQSLTSIPAWGCKFGTGILPEQIGHGPARDNFAINRLC